MAGKRRDVQLEKSVTSVERGVESRQVVFSTSPRHITAMAAPIRILTLCGFTQNAHIYFKQVGVCGAVELGWFVMCADCF